MKRHTSVHSVRAESKLNLNRRSLFWKLAGFLGLAVSGVAAVTVAPLAGVALFASLSLAAFAVDAKGFAYTLGLRTPRLVNQVTGIQGVAASGVGTLNLPVDRRYHSLRVLTTNTAGTLTDPTTIVSLVELIVNGVVMRTGTPATFINIAKTFRITPGTGEIPIFFSEPWRNDTQTAEATSWDMAGQNTFVLRLTFLAPGGGVGVQTVFADFDGYRNLDANGKPFLAIVKQYDISFNAASGQNDITNIPTTYPIQRLFLDVSANAISSVTVFGDQNVVVYGTALTKTQNQDLLNANLLTGTFFEYPIVFDYDSKLASNLRTQYLDVQATTTGAATITAHIQALVPGFK